MTTFSDAYLVELGNHTQGRILSITDYEQGILVSS